MSWEKRDFTKLPNDWTRDDSLSFRARGILAMLMSHTDGWETSIESLVESTVKRDPGHKGSPHEGRDAVRSAVAELEGAGYLVRTKTRTGGRFQVEWLLQEPAPQLVQVPVDNSRRRVGSTATAEPFPSRHRVGSTASVDPTIKEEHSRRDITTQRKSRGEAHVSPASSRCWDRWAGAELHLAERDADTSEPWGCVRCGVVSEPIMTLAETRARLEAEKRA